VTENTTSAVRAADIERPLDLEEAAGMIDRPELLRVDVDAGLPVGDQRVIRPGIPQLGDDLDELAGPLVAQRMVGMRHAEIGAGRGVRRGDGVPRRAPAADMVERGKGARHAERIAVGRGRGGAEPDPAGRHGKRRHHRQRLEAQRIGRMRRRIGIEIVAHEDHVELAALRGPRDLLDRAQILEALDRARIAPAGDVASGSEDEEPEVHPPRRRHDHLRKMNTDGVQAPTVLPIQAKAMPLDQARSVMCAFGASGGRDTRSAALAVSSLITTSPGWLCGPQIVGQHHSVTIVFVIEQRTPLVPRL
jgi:hypothetical protein